MILMATCNTNIVTYLSKTFISKIVQKTNLINTIYSITKSIVKCFFDCLIPNYMSNQTYLDNISLRYMFHYKQLE